MQPNNQAPVGIRKVTKSLVSPVLTPGTPGEMKKKKKKKRAVQGKSAHTAILKDKKVVGRQYPPSPPPPPALFPPAYIGLLSKIVIYAVF